MRNKGVILLILLLHASIHAQGMLYAAVKEHVGLGKIKIGEFKIKSIYFKGNKEYSDNKLKEVIATKENGLLESEVLGSDVNRILKYYNDKGFVNADVKYQVIYDDKFSQAVVVFLILEGNKIKISGIKFNGNNIFKESELINLMEIKNNMVYNKSTLEKDLTEIEKFYRKNGFEDVVVSTPEFSYNDSGNLMYISVNIDEGGKYKISRIEFYGNTVFKDDALRKALTIRKGQDYSQSRVDELKKSISELYADKGYIKCEVGAETERDDANGNVDIRIKITENSIVYVDRIIIEGLRYTREDILRRELVIKERKPLSSSKIIRSVEKLLNLGFLDDVAVDYRPAAEENYTDLVFKVNEGKPGMISVGAGYSTIDRLFGQMQVSQMNLFGRAQKLNLLWEFGDRKQNYEVDWTDPWFRGAPVSIGGSLYDLDRKISYLNDPEAYKEYRQGGDFSLGPRLTENLSFLFTFSYEKFRASDIKPDLPPEYVPVDNRITASIISQVILDSRDNIFNPSRGNRNSLSLQVAGGILGGDVHYYSPVLKSSWFIPALWQCTLSLNTNIGFIEALPGKTLTPYDKFFVGGPDTIRGYLYRGLGPTDGGSIMFVGNIEYKIPVYRKRKQTILQGAFFYDFGGTWSSADQVKFSIGQTQDWVNGKWDNLMKSDIGLGFRLTIPAFPIRLDFSWALQPGRRNPFQFYFTIGQIF